MIEVLYFAWVRETIGRDAERVAPPASVGTLADLVDWLAGTSEAHGRALADRSRLRMAIDQHFAEPGTSIAGAREIAIFPPVTGG